MQELKIGKFTISENFKPFIIAEAGINHNGNIKTAFKMIEVAKKSKVNAIKFQTFTANEFVNDKNEMFTYISQGKKITESMLDMFQRYEFSISDWKKIKQKCDKEKILFLSTPQNFSDLKILLKLGIPAIKIGSDDFTNIPLLKDYSKTKLPIMLSCGMADLSEIFDSLNAIGTFNGYPTILLLTTSLYPTPFSEVNLSKLHTLRKIFPELILGLSDHTQGSISSSMAVSLGSCVFEKHFTLDNNMPGPDHWFSANPIDLENWVTSINDSYSIMGNPILQPSKAESKMKKLARRSIVTIKPIQKNEKFSKKNTGLRRPGTGLPPKFIVDIYGKKASKNLPKNFIIRFGDFN